MPPTLFFFFFASCLLFFFFAELRRLIYYYADVTPLSPPLAFATPPITLADISFATFRLILLRQYADDIFAIPPFSSLIIRHVIFR